MRDTGDEWRGTLVVGPKMRRKVDLRSHSTLYLSRPYKKYASKIAAVDIPAELLFWGARDFWGS
jgi:hypothetical protein